MEGSGCDAELRLGVGHHCPPTDITAPRRPQQQWKQMTVFYNGRICVCDVTEIQARAIISMAEREVSERKNYNHHHHHQDQDPQHRNESLPPQTPPSTPPALRQLLSPGLSMNRSLQRFLQKRKTRLNDASPYNRSHRSPSSPSL